MRNYRFPIRKGEIFRSGKEIKGLRGGVLLYAAQGILQIDTTRAEKNPFRMETKYIAVIKRSPEVKTGAGNPPSAYCLYP